MRTVVAVALAVMAVLVAGCGGDGGGRVVLDGRPRYHDAEGVVTAVTKERLILDGGRTFDVSPQLQAFSTRSLEAVPLLGRSGQYVLIGVDGDTVVWLASVGAVLRVAGQPAVAYYTGELERVDSRRRAVFADGTVLLVAPGVGTPRRGLVRAEIDVDRQVVRALVAV